MNFQGIVSSWILLMNGYTTCNPILLSPFCPSSANNCSFILLSFLTTILQPSIDHYLTLDYTPLSLSSSQPLRFLQDLRKELLLIDFSKRYYSILLHDLIIGSTTINRLPLSPLVSSDFWCPSYQFKVGRGLLLLGRERKLAIQMG